MTAVEYTTVTFELGTDDTVQATMLGTDPISSMDLGTFLTMLNKNERWEAVGMTGGLGGRFETQRQGVVLLKREV